MQKLIPKPLNDYDPLWIEYNKQNRGVPRAVGADDGTGDNDNDDGAGGGDDPTEAPTEAPTETPTEAPGDISWRDAITDPDIAKLAGRYASPADMAKSLHETQGEFRGRIKIPGKDASDEDRVKYRTALGVPEEPDGYEFEKPEYMTDEEFDGEQFQGLVTGLQSVLHEAGTPPHIAQTVMDYYHKLESEGRAAVEANDKIAIEQAEAALRKEWGKDYEMNVKFGDASLERMDATELKQLELKDGTLLGSYPGFLKYTGRTGRGMGEGTLQVGLGGTEAGADLQTKVDELTKQEHDANARGDSDAAQKFNAERKVILEKIHGPDQP
jgi:hypothetical protein